ncbi:conserved serine-threonine rich protein [Aspergillus sp. HF37]|nr:conserved serine-threonine rich protein [Aspergillus sp. HF37]
MSRLIERTGVLRHPRTTAIGRGLSAVGRSTLAPCSGIILYKTPALHTPQTRSLWYFASKRHRGRDSAAFDRTYHQFPIKLRYKRARHHLQQKGFGNRPWWKCGWGLGWCRFKSSFPGRRRRWNPYGDNIWEEEGTRLRDRVERMERMQMQKEIEQDPYTVLFGTRREPFMETGAYRSWSDICRAFLGLGGPVGGDGRAADTTARSKEDGVRSAGFGPVRTSTVPDETAESEFEFDPISGRMVQKPRVVDVDGLGASAKPNLGDMRDNQSAESDGQGASDKPKADSAEELDAKSQQKPARKSAKTGKAKEHADVAHAVPEAQAQASNTGTELPGIIMAKPPEQQSDVAPQHTADSGEAGEQLSESRNVQAPALDVGERPREPGQNAVSDPKQKCASKEEEDLEFLSASDIRASYDSRRPNTDPEIQKQEDRRALEDEFEAYGDPASKIDAQDIQERYDDSANRANESRPATAESGAGMVEPAHGNTALDTETASSQSPDGDQKPPNESTSPAMYRVLAYDSSTLQVTRAETCSSHAANEVLHPMDVLSRLNNPAKFLPHFADMHHDGYEIVSGGGDILVFEKVRTGEGSRAAPAGSDYDTGCPPEDVVFARGTGQPPETKHESVYPGCPPNRPPYPPPTHDQPVSEADIPLPKNIPCAKKRIHIPPDNAQDASCRRRYGSNVLRDGSCDRVLPHRRPGRAWD